jgi:hypothetical protein
MHRASTRSTKEYRMKISTRLYGTGLYAALAAAVTTTAILGGVALLFDTTARAFHPVPIELDASALSTCDRQQAPAADGNERDRCRARVIAQQRDRRGETVREASGEKPRSP